MTNFGYSVCDIFYVVLLPVICFFGVDGTGKTTLARLLAERLALSNVRARRSWMHGSHIFLATLRRILLQLKARESDICIHVPPKLRKLWQLMEFVAALPVILARYVLPDLMGEYVIADRYTPDLVVYIADITLDPCYVSSLEAKIMLSIAMRCDYLIYVESDLNIIKQREKFSPSHKFQIRMYRRIARMLDATILDTTYNAPSDSFDELMNHLNDGHLFEKTDND